VTEVSKNCVAAFTLTGAYLGSWGKKGTANGDLDQPMESAWTAPEGST